jgi:glycosyltransferase involved in cell wall biosynthesis
VTRDRARPRGKPSAANELPSITLVTPSFNQAAFLERTLRSVLDQDYPNLEYIVMDGGSTDGSVDIIRRYASRLHYWQSRPDGGQTAAVNAGWRKGTGEIVAWLNSDDYYLPGALLFAGEYFRDHPETWVMYGSVQLVDDCGKPEGFAGEPFDRRTMITSHNVIPQSSSFLRRAALGLVGEMDESLCYVMDLDLFMRIADHSAPVYVPRALSCQTVHSQAKTTKDRWPMGDERTMVRRRYARGGLERLHVRLQPLATRANHLLPERVRHAIWEIRPRRTFRKPAD